MRTVFTACAIVLALGVSAQLRCGGWCGMKGHPEPELCAHMYGPNCSECVYLENGVDHMQCMPPGIAKDIRRREQTVLTETQQRSAVKKSSDETCGQYCASAGAPRWSACFGECSYCAYKHANPLTFDCESSDKALESLRLASSAGPEAWGWGKPCGRSKDNLNQSDCAGHASVCVFLDNGLEHPQCVPPELAKVVLERRSRKN